MDIIKIIAEGISNDQLSLMVFYVLGVMFLVDLLLYIIIWFNIVSLNYKLKNGYVYRFPLRQLVDGFEDLIKISTHNINTRAYVEDFFSRYKAVVIPLPIFENIKIPLISTIKFIKETVSLFILVGVLGTFVGIYSSLVHLLGSDELLAGLDSISPVLSGMGTAFATSIVGMSLALLTTFILKLFNAEQYLAGVMVRTENYLDNELKVADKSFLAKSFGDIEEGINKGFNRLYEINEKTYNAFKGFAEFSSQFKEAATHMDTFNNNLAASMADLNDFYQTNKKFTEDFSGEINKLSNSLFTLFTSIDALKGEQENLVSFLKGSYDMQNENTKTLVDIRKDFASSQELLQNSFHMFREQLELDSKEITETLNILQDTSRQQKQIFNAIEYLFNDLETLKEEVAVAFENNVIELKETMREIKNSYSSDMNRNVKTFAEHVSLSNKIMTNGMDSINNKFDQMESTMSRYLGGIAFNANDLESVIGDLNKSIKNINDNIKGLNHSFEDFKQILKEERGG